MSPDSGTTGLFPYSQLCWQGTQIGGGGVLLDEEELELDELELLEDEELELDEDELDEDEELEEEELELLDEEDEEPELLEDEESEDEDDELELSDDDELELLGPELDDDDEESGKPDEDELEDDESMTVGSRREEKGSNCEWSDPSSATINSRWCFASTPFYRNLRNSRIRHTVEQLKTTDLNSCLPVPYGLGQ